jgi:hypothetical protein
VIVFGVIIGTTLEVPRNAEQLVQASGKLGVAARLAALGPLTLGCDSGTSAFRQAVERLAPRSIQLFNFAKT